MGQLLDFKTKQVLDSGLSPEQLYQTIHWDELSEAIVICVNHKGLDISASNHMSHDRVIHLLSETLCGVVKDKEGLR